MNGLLKVVTGILGVLAVVACLATVGIIGYSMRGAGENTNPENAQATVAEPTQAPDELLEEPSKEEMTEGSLSSEVTDTEAEGTEDGENGVVPETVDPNHIHDYKESIDIKATCYQAGRLKYTCNCGDYYFVDVLSTGHVEDEWELVRTASAQQNGLRVKKCIYCDETVAQEVLYYVAPEEEKEVEVHYHQYVAIVEREPSCILSGLRKYNCSCGSFYTEKISAMGHVASDWTVAEEPTTTYLGREQRTCNVCGVVLDSRPISALKESSSGSSASPSASAAKTAAPSATASQTPTAKPSASATASAKASASTSPSNDSGHKHSYTSYILKEASCSEKGIRSFVCTCGSSYAEVIEKDANKHSFRMVKIPETDTTPGYTLYTCLYCNYSMQDDYTVSNN